MNLLLTEGKLEKDADGFELIMRHANVNLGYFSKHVFEKGLENENNPKANTYCIIGRVNKNDYLQHDSAHNAGYYDLKLIYQYNDNGKVTEDVLKWTQESWITDSSVVGANLQNIVESTDSASDAGRKFRGLAKSPRKETYLDGNGDAHENWWHAVASTEKYLWGIPGHDFQVAYSSSLWIRPAGIVPIFPVYTFHSYTLPTAVIVAHILTEYLVICAENSTVLGAHDVIVIICTLLVFRDESDSFCT